MRRNNFEKSNSVFAQNAQRQFSELNKAMSSLQDKMSGLQRALRVAKIKPHAGSRYTKKVTTTSGLGNILSIVAGSVVNDALGQKQSFKLSTSQQGAITLQTLGKAQRIL